MERIEKKIMLITTSGCVGCDIQNRHIDEAIKQSRFHRITKVIRDHRNVDRKLLAELKAKDFPITVFMINDEVKFSYVGSYPTAVIVRWIDLYF